MIKLYENYPQLTVVRKEIEDVIDDLVIMHNHKNKLLVCGNGGNSADSDHIVGELVKGFMLPRSLKESSKEQLKPIVENEISCKLQEGLQAIALTNNTALAYAISNDTGDEMVFAQQVYVYGQAGDILICLSTSGNSINVVNSAKIAKARGVKVVGLVGNDGGKLAEFCDTTIIIPETQTYRIQEYMLPIYHYICASVEEIIWGN